MHKTSLIALFLLTHAAQALAADAVIEPPMVAIPAGSFQMGSEGAKPSPDYPVETPVHAVKVAAFQMAKYEVTVKQYRQFVEATGHQGQKQCWIMSSNDWGIELNDAKWDRPPHAQNDYHPVLCVSWSDAKAYTAWLAEKTGKPYRLPSEAEWEYAARAGSQERYHFGADDAQACRFGNMRDVAGRAAIIRITKKDIAKPAPCDDGAEFTTVVGSYAPNPFGLYDMIGNVGEMVEDCEHLTYDGAPADGSAWTGGCRNDMKIHRGGSFWAGASARSTARGHTGIDNASTFEGFRVALGMPASKQVPASAAKFEEELTKARNGKPATGG
jgi:formylglycine-generating enzyme required for sulfatase activity